MNRNKLYLEYRLKTIYKGINPIGKKRFNGIIDVLQEIEQCTLHFVNNSETVVNCMSCYYGDRLMGDNPCIDCDGQNKHIAIDLFSTIEKTILK